MAVFFIDKEFFRMYQSVWDYEAFPITDDESVEMLPDADVAIIQKKTGFRFGTDAVALAYFTKKHIRMKKGKKKIQQVTDLGTGTGIISILLAGLTDIPHFHAIELQEEMAAMSKRSIAGNHLETRITVYCADYTEADIFLGKATQDIVVSNPPYQAVLHSNVKTANNDTHIQYAAKNVQDKLIINSSLQKCKEFTKEEQMLERFNDPFVFSNHQNRITPEVNSCEQSAQENNTKENSHCSNTTRMARHETYANLENTIAVASRLLMPAGAFFMVHRPERLPDIFATMKKYGLEPKQLQMIQKNCQSSPSIVLIRALKGARPNLEILPSLIIDSMENLKSYQ